MPQKKKNIQRNPTHIFSYIFQIDKDIRTLSTDKDYEVLMTSHSSGGDNMFIFTNKRKPHELIIGTIGKDDSSMVVVVGDFSKEDISNFLNQ